MRLKELRGLPVIDPTTARKVGIVTDYQVDPGSSRIAALDIDPVQQTDGNERILSHRIRRVGRHAVILTGRAGNGTSSSLELNDRWLDGASIVGLEVMGDDGNRIGRLGDATFDQDSLDIEAYVLRSTSFWQRIIGRRGRIQPAKVHSCSRELMIVTSGRLEEQPVVTEESMGVPLKVEDRVPAPAVTSMEDGQPVAAAR